LDHEAAGIWRPLAVSGSSQHSRQIALQRDTQPVAVETREALNMSRHVSAFKIGMNPTTLEQNPTQAG
jgi:hypothetical protein